MTNREKWASKITIADELIEDFICKTYVFHRTYGFGDSKQDCHECPIKHLCDLYMDSAHGDGPLISHEEYMAAVSKWLDEEVKDD